jgi:hypothetical protein
VQINLEDLRHHYASLSDEGLLELDRDELTEVAQRCYDEELQKRQLSQPGTPQDEADYEEQAREPLDPKTREKPDWLEDAACVCAFGSDEGGDSASELDQARNALLEGGIPCYVVFHKSDPPKVDPKPHYEYRVMVPGALNLQAGSVLDKEIFNPGVEADWTAHFESLSDDDLLALNSEVICAGLLDRMKRLKRAYEQEVSRRNLG